MSSHREILPAPPSATLATSASRSTTTTPPVQPTRAPPPPPPPPMMTTTMQDVSGRNTRKPAWRPSGPLMQPVVAPPSPPLDDDAQHHEHDSYSPVDARPSSQVDGGPRHVPLSIRTRSQDALSARQTDNVSPVSTMFTGYEPGEVSPVSVFAPPLPPPVEEQPRLPTFAESQAAYGHTNPLLAHPAASSRTRTPSSLEQSSRARSQSSTTAAAGNDNPRPRAPPNRKPVPNNHHARSNTVSDPSSSSRGRASSRPGNNANLVHAKTLPPPSAAVRRPAPERAASASKPGFFSQLGHKTSSGLNNMAQKLGGTKHQPDTLDNECEKAATILMSFCGKGVYVEQSLQPQQSQPPQQSPDPPPQPADEYGVATGAVLPPLSLIPPPISFRKQNKSPQPPQQQRSSAPSQQPADEYAVATGAVLPPLSLIPPPLSFRKQPKKLVTIPEGIIRKAVGLAIFNTTRAGLNFRGATGSGVLVARRHDGSWGGPSAIQMTSIGGGVAVGLDIFDCVCVINTQESLKAFMDSRVSIGVDVAVVPGPWGAGGSLEGETSADNNSNDTGTSRQMPPNRPALDVSGEPSRSRDDVRTGAGGMKSSQTCYSYVKSRGFYVGTGYDGTMMTECPAANAAFYDSEHVTGKQILVGQIAPPADNPSLKKLWDALRIAEGSDTAPDGASPTEVARPVPEIVEPREEEASQGLPPAYPADSLHPIEAYRNEKN